MLTESTRRSGDGRVFRVRGAATANKRSPSGDVAPSTYCGCSRAVWQTGQACSLVRSQNPRSRTIASSHTAIHISDSPFNGLNTLKFTSLHGLLLTCKPRRDGRLSWLTHSRQITYSGHPSTVDGVQGRESPTAKQRRHPNHWVASKPCLLIKVPMNGGWSRNIERGGGRRQWVSE